MNELGMTARILIAVVSLPLVAWLGAVLTREGRPLARVVARHYRPLVAGLVLFQMAVRLLANDQNARTATFLELGATYLLALLFVPMLRGFQQKTEQSLRRDAAAGRDDPHP